MIGVRTMVLVFTANVRRIGKGRGVTVRWTSIEEGRIVLRCGRGRIGLEGVFVGCRG
jgi:hypothetical protein